MVSSIKHAITVDLEDWFHVCGLKEQPDISRRAWRVSENCDKLLKHLEKFGIKATFFVLGAVAEAEPALIKRIHQEGHEIASHGYSHALVYSLTAEQFTDELKKTEDIISVITDEKLCGFRAPQWSVPYGFRWFDDILARCGYLYDSSRNPLLFIGKNSALRSPYPIKTESGKLWELPPMVTRVAGINLPTGGGWGFRFFQPWMVEATIAEYQRKNYPAVLYLHPRDFDPNGPRLDLPVIKGFVSYGLHNDALPRLDKLYRRFSFTTIKGVITSCLSAF